MKHRRLNDNKIIRIIKDESNVESLQKDVDSVTNWTEKWQMKLNSRKCKGIHFGNKKLSILLTIRPLNNELNY